jgi:hypothetical protein
MTKIAESDPDPLVRGTDPRIRIHTKMSRVWKRPDPNLDTCGLFRIRILFERYRYLTYA